jgi:hypothetical protein
MSELRVDRIKHINAGASTPFMQLDSSGNVNHTGTMTVGTLRTDNLQDSTGAPLLAGGVLQVVQRVSQSYGEFGNTAYNNDNNNLTAISDWYVDITTTKANSRILVQWKTKMFGPNQQHQYVDLRRSINNGSFTSLITANRTDGTIDTFAGIHWQNGNGAFEGDYFSQFVDTPNQAAGTILRYRQYLGGWAAGTIDFGGWDANNNQNARGMIVMVAWEIGA